jgi:acetyl esterase
MNATIAMLIGMTAVRTPAAVAQTYLDMAHRRITSGRRLMDPKAQLVGELINLVRVPGYVPTPAEARAQMAKMIALLESPPPPLPRKEDRSLPGPAGDLPVRIYGPRPLDDDSVLPVLAYFHGGGFVQGDLDTHDAACAKLALWADCLVVAVHYRLAPEHRFPAGVEDCHCAFRWLAAHAGEIGGDPRRVAVGGDSAGGNLAAVVSQITAGQGAALPCAQVLIYPVVDNRHTAASYREFRDGFVIPHDRIAWYDAQYMGAPADADDPRCSPMRTTDLAGQPPALVITAGFDPLRDEGQAYAERLQAAGVPVAHTEYDGQIHGFITMSAAIPQADACLRQIADWLKRRFLSS